MSYQDGKIFIDTTTNPHIGVSIADIQQALRRGTGDLGLLCSDQEWRDNNGTPALRRVNKINKWAKYKPVRSSKLGILTDSDYQDVNFGLVVPVYGNATGEINNIVSFITALDTSWEYQHPRGKGNGTGGANEWFRLRDFNGYNKNARSFVFPEGSTFPARYIWGRNDSGCRWEVGLNTGDANLRGGISINDIKLGGHSGTSFYNLYFGLIFVGVENNTTVYKIVTNGTLTLGQISAPNKGTEVFIAESNNNGLTGLAKSTYYTVYPILSSVPHGTVTTIGNATSERLIPLPVEKFYFHQETIAATVNLSLSNPTAEWKTNQSLLVKAKIGLSSTDPGTTSIGTVHCNLYPAGYVGDDSQTTVLVGGSWNIIGPVTTSTTLDLYYNNKPTRPTYVRIVVNAPDYPTIPAVTEYAYVTEQELPE